MSESESERPPAAGVAFFDVDETLLSVRTLEAFLFHYLKQTPTMVSPERLRELGQQVIELDRSEFNRVYFGLWAGQPVERVREAGRSWYAAASAEPGFFRANVLDRLREHRDAGAHVVLVSGSFEAPLAPLAAELDVDGLYCTGLEIVDGVYTGRISAPMIGDDKRLAVESYLASLRTAADRAAGVEMTDAASTGADATPLPSIASWGYGDHPSDLSLLESVTTPIVVGSDPVMLELAAERDWDVLPIDRPLAPRAAEH